MAKKKERGKEGSVVKYITRNQALNRLQIKLPEFRRLCILKGVHPREPKKKVHGHNKTYYHIKDINFLAHEPLLFKGRDLKVHQKKVKKARAKLDKVLLERLKNNPPEYNLDHLVKERYPSFIDALRDLDDGLTLVHLFATLPADSSHKIPADRVHKARRLSLEWQAYVSRTHSLRKVFISVKGTYYQAEVWAQKVTWLVPHPLSQIIPPDVDFRVMLTFLEFYETLLSFTNFKLYHELGLSYPPILDSRLEAAAADLYAIMRDLAAKAKSDGTPIAIEGVPKEDGNTENKSEQSAEKTEGEQEEEKKRQEEHKELIYADTAVRLASLQSRLSAMQAVSQKGGEGEDKESMDTEGLSEVGRSENLDEGEVDDEETRKCRQVFKGLVFFLAREIPRESLLFVIRSFGGIASWDGEGAPFPENDDSITHQVVDRPSQKHRHLSREYVQPQWLFDCANVRLLLSTPDYGPGLIPPPHLSPFVDNESEGYTPEYATAIDRMRKAQEASTNGVAALPGTEEDGEVEDSRTIVALRTEDAAVAAKLAEVEAQEKAFVGDLAKEVSGVPYSASLEVEAGLLRKREEEGEEREEGEAGEEGEEEEDKKEKPTSTKAKNLGGKSVVGTDLDDDTAMAQVMMPRKTKKLYEAMQMGKAKKRARVELLEERKKKAKENAGVSK